ncbi:MAG: AAA family ATPase [Pseudonocardia sp.]|nr:AAA family ATPase [Pseudonocardia sp.]
MTVLIGRNGSGKSSIADAIETALHGEPRAPTSTGRGGKAPLRLGDIDEASGVLVQGGGDENQLGVNVATGQDQAGMGTGLRAVVMRTSAPFPR